MKKIILILTGVALISCASSAPAQRQQEVPRWISQPPREEAGAYVFVISGTNETGNESEAERLATNDLIEAIVREFGVRITAQSTAREVGTVDSLRRELDNVVKSRSEARIRGMRIAERFVVRRDNTVTVYLKALYEKAEFEAEKARVQAVFREREESVSGPEREGDDLRSRGLFLQAVEKYVQAAKASLDQVSGAELDNAEIKYNRNLNKAREILNAMTIQTNVQRLEGAVGQAFTQPVVATVVYGSDQRPVPQVPLRFSYRIRRNNQLTTTSTTVMTDNQGRASFTHPTPNFSGNEQVIISVDANPFIDIIGRVPSRFQPQVDALEEAAAKTRTNVAVVVTSNARNVATALALDNPEVQASLLNILTGWRVTPITARTEQLQGDTATVISGLRGQLANRNRLIYGTFTTNPPASVGGQSEVRAQGVVQVVDVTTGEVLFSASRNRTARGANAQAAASAALRQLGELFGREIADNLP
jgi:hypothetical protein